MARPRDGYQTPGRRTARRAARTPHALLAGRLPPGWAKIDGSPQTEQVRVTLRMDMDVALFFRSYGQGYQSLIAKVLRAFMLSTVIELRAVAEGDRDSDALELERILAAQLEELRARRMSG